MRTAFFVPFKLSGAGNVPVRKDTPWHVPPKKLSQLFSQKSRGVQIIFWIFFFHSKCLAHE